MGQIIKKQRSVFSIYTEVDITQRINDNNDLKLTMLGGRLFQTLMIRSLKKMFSHINTTMVDEQFVWVYLVHL